MVEIHITLPEALNEYIESQVLTGQYQNVGDYLQTLVRADQEQRQTIERLQDNSQLESYLKESLDNGQGRRWSSDVLAELKQQVIDRAAKEVG